MAKKAACPQCGARNDLDARRCRVCANLLNADIPEAPHKPKGLPDSVQRQIESELGLSGEIPAPSFSAAPPPPPPPPPPVPPLPSDGPVAAPPPPPPSAGGHPPPPAGSPGVFAADDPYATPGQPASAAAEPPPLYEVADDEPFDPDALFRDMARSHLPPPPPPPPPPDELRLPPPPAPEPDVLWSVGQDLGSNPTSEDIERATREALRQERLRKRPGFLDRVFKGDEGDQQQ
jgi:hypothetical protein